MIFRAAGPELAAGDAASGEVVGGLCYSADAGLGSGEEKIEHDERAH